MTDSTGDQPVTFAALALRPELVDALAELGYEEPTPIQQAAIPALLAGRDVLGQAATGTGKTAAFALPLLDRLGAGVRTQGGPAGLVLVPTRELAVQVSEAARRYGRRLGARVVAVYGGQPIGPQIRSLAAGADVVVATPGRALDHLNRGTLDLSALAMLVLDEADEMLDMGFAEDLEAIFARLPESRQTVLFSATIPARIESIAGRHLRDPERIRIVERATPEGEAPRVRHVAYVVARPHKAAALGRVLDVEGPTAALVFCRTREVVDSLSETLNGRGYRAEPLHGGMSQEQRERVMGRLRGGTADLIVATDVAARGLDIEQLSHVVNFDVPSSVDAYVHRMGRVGRAGREGVAITLAEPRELRMLKTIEHVTKRTIAVEKVPTAADLRTRRLDATRAAVQQMLVGGDFASVRPVVESLLADFEPVEVALAAVALLHAAASPATDEQDIPEPVPSGPRRERPAKSRPAPERGRGRPDHRPEAAPGRHTARLYIGVGRDDGVRPGDLVGAITGETGLRGGQIGAIDIAPRFSIVEVPADAAPDVISAMRGAKIRGRRATVRPDRA